MKARRKNNVWICQQKKYDDLKEKYDSEYYKAEAIVRNYDDELLKRFVDTKSKLIELEAKHTEEVRKNLEFAERLKSLSKPMDEIKNENFEKAIEYLKNEEAVSITKYGKDIFVIITGEEKILLWAKENKNEEL